MQHCQLLATASLCTYFKNQLLPHRLEILHSLVGTAFVEIFKSRPLIKFGLNEEGCCFDLMWI
jgi:hypothetical protein